MTAPAQLALLDEYGLPAKHDEPSPTSTPSRRSKPLAANADPGNSHLAARRVIMSGRLASAKRALYEHLLTNRGWRTSAEIARDSDRDRHDPGRRLSDLEADGLVERLRDGTGKAVLRLCSVSGTPCVVWRAIDAGRQQPTASTHGVYRQAESTSAQHAPVSAECTRCARTGVMRVPASSPPILDWCDYLTGRPCTYAQRRRRINLDPYAELSPAELEAVAG